MGHFVFQLHIPAGDDDGVVDVGAHLNGADHQIAHEEQRRAGKGGYGEVDPDAALDDQDQQDGHSDGLEGEQQHQQHDEDGHRADHRVVPTEGLLEVVFRAGIAHHVDVAFRVILPGGLRHGVQEGVGLLTALRQCQVDQHPVVGVALELEPGVGELLPGVVQGIHLFVIQCHVALVQLVADKEEHIHQGDAVRGDAANDLSEFLVLGRVGGVNAFCQLIVQVCQLGELPGRQAVRRHIAVHGLHVGKPQGVVHLVPLFQVVEHHPLGGVVSGGDHQGYQVGGGEGVVDHLLRDLDVVELGRLNAAVAVGIGAVPGEVEGQQDHRQKDRRNDEAGPVGEAAHEGDGRYEAAVAGPVHQGAEQHQQSGHHHKHRQQGEQDGFDEADGHVGADAELHEHHGHQSANGGEGAGADLRDGLAQCHDGGLPNGQGLVLILESVAEDDGVIQGQRQLQNTGDGVGHEGDLSQQEVGAHVHDHARHEGEQQHRHLRVGLGGEQQHHQDDDGHVHHDDVDLGADDVALGIAQRGGDVNIVAGQAVLHRLQGLQTGLVLFVVVEGDVVQGGGLGVVVGGIVKGDALHTLQLGKLRLQGPGGVQRNIGNHHPGGAEGGELVLHHVQALPGLRLRRQVKGHVVLHLHPVPGEHGEDHADDHQKKEQVAFVHDEGGQLHHEAFVLRFVVCHRSVSFPGSFQQLAPPGQLSPRGAGGPGQHGAVPFQGGFAGEDADGGAQAVGQDQPVPIQPPPGNIVVKAQQGQCTADAAIQKFQL